MRYPWLCALTVRQIESAKERSKSRKHRVRSRLILEALEQRCLLSAYGTITGFGNNIADPPSGEAGVDLLRVSQYSYANGIGPPSQPMARIEAIAGGEMGACFFSDGSCEQMTEGTCEAVGGISWRAGEPCPCSEFQTTDRLSDVLTGTISGAGQTPPRLNSTSTAFALLAGASNASIFTQSKLGVPSTPPVAAQTPIMAITDKEPDVVPVGGAVRSVVSVAETVNRDTFFRLYGANDRRTASLEFLHSGETNYIGL